MIPTYNDDSFVEYEFSEQPGKTYKMNVYLDNGLDGQIAGYVDGRKAVEQAIYKILNTERGEWEMYGEDYGVEIQHLFGKDMGFVIPELDRCVTEALKQDDRITSVKDFEFEIVSRGVLAMSFTAVTPYGDINITQKVQVA